MRNKDKFTFRNAYDLDVKMMDVIKMVTKYSNSLTESMNEEQLALYHKASKELIGCLNWFERMMWEKWTSDQGMAFFKGEWDGNDE